MLNLNTVFYKSLFNFNNLSFSRNNVVHLWDYCIEYLKKLGAKFFFGKFCTGSLHTISKKLINMINELYFELRKITSQKNTRFIKCILVKVFEDCKKF